MTTSQRNGSRPRRREPVPPGFWALWTTVALDMVGFGIVVPILGRYASRFDASGFAVGALFASYSLAQMVCAPLLGRASDRIGRKPVLVLSLVGSAVGSFVTGAAGALWVLFLGRIIDGCSGASIAVAQGAVGDMAPPEQRARLLGLLGAAFGVGFVLGPALGGLAALGGPHLPFFVAGTVAAVNAVVAAVRLPEPRRPAAGSEAGARVDSPTVHDPGRDWRRDSGLAAMAAAMFVAVLAFSGFESTFALFGEVRFDLTEGSTAVLFLGIGVTMVAVQAGAIGALTSAFGSRTLLRAGLVVVGLGMFVLASARTWPVLLAGLALLAAGQSVVSPSNSALVSEMAPPGRRGEALGYVQSAGAFARVAGPLAAGALFEWSGEATPYVVGGILTVAVAVVIGRVAARGVPTATAT